MSATINLCAVMMVDAMKGVLKFYRPDEERSFAAWYKREVSGPLLELGRIYARLGIGRTTEPQADV